MMMMMMMVFIMIIDDDDDDDDDDVLDRLTRQFKNGYTSWIDHLVRCYGQT